LREIFALSEHTKPFALLLGEEKDENEFITANEKTDDTT